MADEYWFPWYPGHYERDAGHLDHVADSCYRRLIDAYMRAGEPIPRDPVRLMHITRTTPQQFQSIWPQIEGFFTQVNGHLHLRRCNIELDRQDQRRKFASEAGKRSGEKRRKTAILALMGPSDEGTTVERPLNDRSRTTVERPLNDRSLAATQQNQPVNDLGTTVEQPLNDPRNEGREQDKTINITTTGPIPANGHGPEDVKKMIGVSLRGASRPSQRDFTKEERHEAWKQKMMRFMRSHWSTGDTKQAADLMFSDDPAEQDRGLDIFNAASRDYEARKKAGTLNPDMDDC